MRYLLVFLIFGIFTQAGAKNRYEKLPPSEMIMMDFSDEDDVELIEDFSFSSQEDDENVTEIYVQERRENVDPSQFVGEGSLKVALLVPKNIIGSYANSVSNSIISYLLFKDTQFVFEIFDSKDELESSITQKLSEIKAKGFQFIIAPLTQNGAQIVARHNPEMLIFIPTINRADMGEVSENIIFGGIDYRRQIDLLLSYANEKVALFGDGSRLSTELSSYTKQMAYDRIVYAKDIKNIKTDLSTFIKKNKKLKKSSIFLNMPIVKSSLLASQLTQYKIEPHVLLSTQVNYNPLLFKLTQQKDREFFYIANSISYINPKLKEINLLLGNSPDYNWIDYSSSIGIDYVFANNLGAGSRVFEEDIYDNQIEYKVQIKKAGGSSFVPISVDMPGTRY